MSKVKCIGVLTSGGDSPGMNAAIRAVVRLGAYEKLKVLGIRKGYHGLINGDIVELGPRSVSDIIHKGGTMLQTARSAEFMTVEGRQKAIAIAKMYDIDGLVVIGGDGSFRGARELNRLGLPTIGIPGTIDNDIACSEYTIGFDTAVNTAVDCINKLRDTASSHGRCSVIEVMGRNAGHIAIACGIAGGADFVSIPEKEFKQEEAIKAVLEAKNRGKTRYLIVNAEGIGHSYELANAIQTQTGIECRATVLGHIQRGGMPTAFDINVATIMGAKAVELLLKGVKGRVIAVKAEKIIDYDIEEALNMKKSIDEDMYKLINMLAI